ncbi:MAG: lysozyme inhibitor LprI family protein [Clostridium sp.]|uniref:lysozyme inhibitor LprI family protein n=1 Tax=Clostridium sp. TaxID=1506 RepID=UPI003D6D4F3D
MSVKNKVLISSSIILLIVFVVGSNYYFSKVKPYNNLLNNANQAMNKEEYDKAVTLYGEALSYKDDLGVNRKLDFATVLGKSKETYSIAVKQMEGKEYLTAIESYTKVDNQDTKRYSDSQSSISECKKLYISDNLKKAKDNIRNKKFDEANKYISDILKFDAKNTDANKLKEDIVAALQNQKNDVAELSKVISQDNNGEDQVQSRKQEFINKLNNIKIELSPGQRLVEEGTESQNDLNNYAFQSYGKWDKSLNEIYNVLEQQLSSNDMEKLKNEESNWIAQKEAIAQRDSEDMRGGTGEDYLRYTSLAKSTQERCYQLVEKVN